MARSLRPCTAGSFQARHLSFWCTVHGEDRTGRSSREPNLSGAFSLKSPSDVATFSRAIGPKALAVYLAMYFHESIQEHGAFGCSCFVG